MQLGAALAEQPRQAPPGQVVDHPDQVDVVAVDGHHLDAGRDQIVMVAPSDG